MTKAGQAGNPSARRFRDQNRPPEGEPWVWYTRDMLESESWRALPSYARQVVDRVVLEHMKHGGKLNGALPVTYDDFAAYGIRRASIPSAIAIAIDLGWIDLTERGVRAYGIARRPNKFGLTWLPRADWTQASDRWRNLTREEARAVLARHRGKKSPEQPIGRKRTRARETAAA